MSAPSRAQVIVSKPLSFNLLVMACPIPFVPPVINAFLITGSFHRRVRGERREKFHYSASSAASAVNPILQSIYRARFESGVGPDRDLTKLSCGRRLLRCCRFEDKQEQDCYEPSDR